MASNRIQNKSIEKSWLTCILLAIVIIVTGVADCLGASDNLGSQQGVAARINTANLVDPQCPPVPGKDFTFCVPVQINNSDYKTLNVACHVTPDPLTKNWHSGKTTINLDANGNFNNRKIVVAFNIPAPQWGTKPPIMSKYYYCSLEDVNGGEVQQDKIDTTKPYAVIINRTF